MGGLTLRGCGPLLTWGRLTLGQCLLHGANRAGSALSNIRPRHWLLQSSPRREPRDCHVPCVDRDVSPSRRKKPELRPALKRAGEGDAIVAGTAGPGSFGSFVDMFQNQWSFLCCLPGRTALLGVGWMPDPARAMALCHPAVALCLPHKAPRPASPPALCWSPECPSVRPSHRRPQDFSDMPTRSQPG